MWWGGDGVFDVWFFCLFECVFEIDLLAVFCVLFVFLYFFCCGIFGLVLLS